MKNKALVQLKELAFTGWNGMRWFRLALGIMILIQGIKSNDWILNIIAISLVLQAVFNAGCCSNGGCYAPINKTKEVNTEIEFEEIQKNK